MTNQIQSVRGRVMRHASRYMLMGLLIAGATWASVAMAAAGTTLKNISYDALPGGAIELHMDFGNGPVPEPKIFTTGTPPRIAVDFADTDNAAARHLDIGKGSTSGVSAVEAGGRTRVVIELMRASSYRSRVEGHSLVLTINNGTADESTTTVATIDPSKALPSISNGASISNIDFRRGPNGEGRVLISFNGSGVNAQMTRKGDKLLVNIDNANLPPNLAQRLDTLDFATPVQSIVTHAGIGGGARMEIAITGNVDTSAYQTAGQYVVEVTPKQADPKANALAKLGQEPSYDGKRVMVPRETAGRGDGMRQHWTPILERVRDMAERHTGTTFDYCFLNRYRDGRDAVAWHGDRDGTRDARLVVASLSLGATRQFQLRPKKDSGLMHNPISVDVNHGDLVIMAGDTQLYWEHRVPRDPRITGERLNVTFRQHHARFQDN